MENKYVENSEPMELQNIFDNNVMQQLKEQTQDISEEKGMD